MPKLLLKPDKDLLDYVRRIQLFFSRLEKSRVTATAEKVDILNKIAAIVENSGFSEKGLSEADREANMFYMAPDQLSEYLLAITTEEDNFFSLIALMNAWREVNLFLIEINHLYSDDQTEILLSTVQSRSANARTFPYLSANIRVICFDDRIVDLIESISFLLPSALSSERVKLETTFDFIPIASNFAEDVPFSENFAVVLNSFILRHVLKEWSKPQLRWSQFLSDDIRLAAQDIQDSMMYFLIGHELAHILEKHTGETHNWAMDDHEQIKEVNIRHEQEFEADFVGFKIGLGAAIKNGIPHQLFCWAVQIFFNINKILDELRNSHDPVTIPKSITSHNSHPLMKERCRFMEEIIADQLSKIDSGQRGDKLLPEVLDHFIRAVINNSLNSTLIAT